MDHTLGFDDFIKFAGGTLVEYANHKGFDQEWHRGVIVRIQYYGKNGKNSAHIQTTTTAEFATGYLDQHVFSERDGVLYISPKNGPLAVPVCYAIAAFGIAIPTPQERIAVVSRLAS